MKIKIENAVVVTTFKNQDGSESNMFTKIDEYREMLLYDIERGVVGSKKSLIDFDNMLKNETQGKDNL